MSQEPYSEVPPPNGKIQSRRSTSNFLDIRPLNTSDLAAFESELMKLLARHAIESVRCMKRFSDDGEATYEIESWWRQPPPRTDSA